MRNVCPLLARLTALLLVAGLLAPPGAFAAEEPAVAPTEIARKKAIKGLRTKLRRASRSVHAFKKHEEILKFLDTLKALGGHEAGLAALEAVPVTDAKIRDSAFDVVETNHHPRLVAPLALLLDTKAYRRDADLQKRVAHALAVMADAKAIEPLTSLVRTDIDAEVVAEAAGALATYAAQPIEKKRDAVKRLIDVYATTYNYMMSMRPEDKVMRKKMGARYKVYGKPVRHAMQALTGQQLSRAQEWRHWWNKNKKAKKWPPGPR